MTMDCFHPGTRRGIRGMTIGSRKTVPLRMLRMVPFGDLHISFKLNSVISKGLWICGIVEGMWRSTLDTGFVGSDGSTLDTDVVLLNSVGSIDGDLIVCGITVFHA